MKIRVVCLSILTEQANYTSLLCFTWRNKVFQVMIYIIFTQPDRKEI